MAAGTGNAALAAASRGAQVTATDFVPAMLEVARRRAEVEGLTLQTEVADAQAMPFPDDSFDVALSTSGAMFAANQTNTAGELLRVCRPGGRIAMANWTPGGLVDTNLAILRNHLAPPAAAQSHLPVIRPTGPPTAHDLGLRLRFAGLAIRLDL